MSEREERSYKYETIICDLRAKLQAAEAELDSMRERFSWTYCAYCGDKFPADAPESIERIAKHIHECIKHPIGKIAKENETLQAEVARLMRIESTLQTLYNSNRVAADEAWIENESLRSRIAALEAGIREYLMSENDGVEGQCGDPNCDICQSLAGLRALLGGEGK